MARNRDISAEDKALFRANVGKVRRIRTDQASVKPRPPDPIPRQTLAEEQQVLEDLGSLDFDPAEMETGEELLYRGAGLQDRQFRRLRRGQFRVEGELDLHGYTADAARLAVAGLDRKSVV